MSPVEEDGHDLRQAFLKMLGGRSSDPEPVPPGEGPSAPEGSPAPEPAPTSTTPEPAPPLTYEEEPPPAEEVPAAMTALAAEEPASPPPAAPEGQLMNLGYDAQVQGTALGLRSISQRLAVISEGLKLIPALQNIARDLQHLNYSEVAGGVDALIAWAQSEEKALMGELEQRTAARQGFAPEQ